MFRISILQLAILVVVMSIRTDIAWNVARCDDSIAKEVETKILALADDFEFGLLDVASIASLSIETTPDSEYWFEGSATFTTFKSEKVEYKRAEWKLDHIDDARMKKFSNYFDFHQCTVTNLRISERDFVKPQGIDRWVRGGEHASPCVSVNPLDWPVTKFDDVSVPSKVKAELNINGTDGIQTVHLNVDLKFWNSKTKEYKQIENSVDQSIQEVEASGMVAKTK